MDFFDKGVKKSRREGADSESSDLEEDEEGREKDISKSISTPSGKQNFC